jgi:hypothetical protein
MITSSAFERRLNTAIGKLASDDLVMTPLNSRIFHGWNVSTDASSMSEIFSVREVAGRRYYIGTPVSAEGTPHVRFDA